MAKCKRDVLKQIISWGLLEAVLFQALLIIHNIWLFNRISLVEYGIVGVIFSVAYGLAYGATTGFDFFYTQETLSHKTNPLHIQYIWVGIFFGVTTIIGHAWIEAPLLTLALGAIEAIKRSLKIVATNHRQFARVTSYELINAFTYCSIIWSISFFGYTLCVLTLIVPLIITTSICAIAYVCHTPFYGNCVFDNTTLQSLYARIILCIGTLYQIIFSDNIMVPIAYTVLGPIYAGGIKLASSCTHGIITIMERLLNTGAILLNDHKDHAIVYRVIGSYVWYAATIGTLLSGVLIGYTFWKQHCLFLLPYAGLYIILRMASMLSVLCKRIFITKSPHKTPFITLISIIITALSFGIGTYTSYPFLGIIIFVFARILLSMYLGIATSLHIDRYYFATLAQNLALLFLALFLCALFACK